MSLPEGRLTLEQMNEQQTRISGELLNSIESGLYTVREALEVHISAWLIARDNLQMQQEFNEAVEFTARADRIAREAMQREFEALKIKHGEPL